MRHLTCWVIACLIAVSTAVVAPAGLAAASVSKPEAREAIDAALVQARVSGVTYEVDGEVHQRNGMGDVAVLVVRGRVDRMLLRDGRAMQVLTPLVSATDYPRIVSAVRDAYGIGARPLVMAPVDSADEPTYATWFDPFAGVVGDPAADVVVDEAGRATEVRVNGATTMRILAWAAPLAVRPASDRVVTEAVAATASAVEQSADLSYSLLKQLAAIANRDAAYSSERVATLRRVARDTGWQARTSSGGVTITTTDSLGATWRGVLVAGRSGVRVEEFALLSHRKAMPRAQTHALLSLGIMAMSQVDLLSCPASCRMTGKPAPLTRVNAETRILDQLGRIGITGQTPGPAYPSIGDGMTGSFGLAIPDQRISGGFAMSAGGFCLRVPIVGPGVLPRPAAYRAVPGSVGPLGTCALSPGRA